MWGEDSSERVRELLPGLLQELLHEVRPDLGGAKPAQRNGTPSPHHFEFPRSRRAEIRSYLAAAAIDFTAMVSPLRVPVTVTLSPANCRGVFWSLNWKTFPFGSTRTNLLPSPTHFSVQSLALPGIMCDAPHMLSLMVPTKVCCFGLATARPTNMNIALHSSPAFLMTTLLDGEIKTKDQATDNDSPQRLKPL